MVDVMGHVAMALLWTAPAWFRWPRRASLAFVGIAAFAAPLPDVDLWIEKVAPALIHHHGVTHTVVFVAGLSVVVGASVAATQSWTLDRWLGGERFTTENVFVFAGTAFLLGGLSHLFADILSAPDIAQPIEPFWPVYPEPVIVDLIWYNAPLWNVGLLTATVLLHLVLALVVDPFDHES
jgi:membrane-bound metal-dependent hydrolase YbcI (DUF457 family)